MARDASNLFSDPNGIVFWVYTRSRQSRKWPLNPFWRTRRRLVLVPLVDGEAVIHEFSSLDSHKHAYKKLKRDQFMLVEWVETGEGLFITDMLRVNVAKGNSKATIMQAVHDGALQTIIDSIDLGAGS